MGVPKFYRWISERYPCLSETVKEFQIPEFDNLYLDMNGIIHVCSHPEDDNPHFRITEEKIFADIMYYLEFLFRMIKPRKVFFMAVDGVAPRAKMNQQRGRRFRSAREAEVLENKARDRGEVLPTEKRFDSNCITPGTPFMVRLQEQLKYFVVKKVSTDPLWHGVRVYLSGHETPGEGEHKIMDFIRAERAEPGYDPNTRHCLYGLDADLMMLGLATHEPHFSLLREEVRFGGRKDKNKRPATPEETTFHLLHLSLFREYLDFEFSALKDKELGFPYDLEAVIDDWVMMGFLVGNDFIPHLPNLHINHDALPLLWQTYMDVLPSCGGYINNGGHLNLERFEKYLIALSKFDFDKFSEQAGDLKWLEGKKAAGGAERQELLSAARKFRKNIRKAENQFNALISPDDDMDGLDDDIGDELLESPEDNSVSEELSDDDSTDDTLDDEFRHHKRNYYMTKMEYEKVTPEVLRDQAEGYVRGIQWILLYYYEGVPSWSWFYPHHYAPYMSDVKDFKDMEIHFDIAKPFLPFEQLMAVLPAASKELLPQAFQTLMTTESSPVIDFYPARFDTDLNGKQQDWEAVVLIPFIDEKRLLDAMRTLEYLMTDEEKSRNIHGPCLLYQHTHESQGTYQSPIPGVFPDVAFNHSKLTEVPKEAFWIPSENLVKGILPGAQLDVFYPGFPTLKHIKHRAELRKEQVKVFQMNSRGYNMMLHVEEEGDREIEQVAKEYLGKEIYVCWPHLYEAKVISVSDDAERFVTVEAQGKGGKTQKTSPRMQVQRQELDETAANIVEREAKTIAERYKERLGVIVGPISILIKALPMTGRKYMFGSHGRVTTEKQFGTFPVSFALQTTVKDIAVHNPDECPYKSLQEYLPEKSTVFMMGWPHYGCQGEVIEVDNTENGRVRINITIIEEPNVSRIMNNQQSHTERYIPTHIAAQRLGVGTNFLNRITGTIRVNKKGGDQMIDIGLNLKFTKRQEEAPGYTKMFEGRWGFSEKAIETIEQYMEKFPQMFDLICNNEKRNDDFPEEEIFPEGCDYKLQDVTNYIKSLPCSGVKLVKSGTDIISEGVVSALENEAKSVAEINRKRQKRVKLQVKPHLLYRPMPKQGALVPDSTATYQLFDRVVNVREGFSVPFGLRGTVVGIHTAEVEVNTMYEVLFDEEFVGGISVRSSASRGYRMPPSGLLNITHGERKNGVKPPITPQSQAQQSNSFQGNQFSNSFQGNQFPNNNQGSQFSNNFQGNQFNKKSSGWATYSALKGSYDTGNNNAPQAGNQGRSYHDNRGSYSNQNKGSESNVYTGVGGWTSVDRDKNQFGQQSYGHGQRSQQSYGQGQPSQQSFGRGQHGMPISQQSFGRGQQNWNRGQGQMGNQSNQNQPEALAGQVFNGEGSGKPMFVTPRVSSTSRRSSQGEGQPGKATANQENTTVNSEFENMWKVLKGDSSSNENQENTSKGTSLSKAAAVLPIVPSSASDHLDKNKNNNQRDSTKIDVENLFTQASKIQGNDEFSAMFRSLELSNQEKLAASEENIETSEDGAIVIKRALHETSADAQEVAGGGGKSYGRQVSVQELFDGAKQTLDSEAKGQETKSDTETKGQEISPPQQKQQSKQKKQQRHRQQQQQQQQNQGQQKRPNLLVQFGGGRNPVMELMNFCQSLQMGLPMYDYIPKSGLFFCVVSFVTGARFQGSLCKTREEAAESAASVALLQMKGSMQQMAAQTMMRGGLIPQGRQFSSPNSAFSPVQGFGGQVQYPQPGQYPMFAQQPYRGGQRSQQHQRGSYRPQHQQSTNQHQQPTNQDSGYKNQQQSNQGKVNSANESLPSKSEAPKLTSQNVSNKPVASGSQSAEVKTCIVNPFVPLQVVKKQTPQKNRKESASEDKTSKEDNSVDSIPKGDKSNDSLLQADNSSSLSKTPVTKSSRDKSTSDVKTENVSKHLDSSTDKNKTESASRKTPPSSTEKEGTLTTPGKPKSKRRLAANFDFAPSAP